MSQYILSGNIRNTEGSKKAVIGYGEEVEDNREESEDGGPQNQGSQVRLRI